jgi:hypothetical protein
MDAMLFSSFIVLAAARFIGTRWSGLNINETSMEEDSDASSPEEIVEDFYATILEQEVHAESGFPAKTSSYLPSLSQDENPVLSWPVIQPGQSRVRGVMVEGASVDGNRAIVPVRTGYMNPAGEFDLRWKYGVLMEKDDGRWQIVGVYNR